MLGQNNPQFNEVIMDMVKFDANYMLRMSLILIFFVLFLCIILCPYNSVIFVINSLCYFPFSHWQICNHLFHIYSICCSPFLRVCSTLVLNIWYKVLFLDLISWRPALYSHTNSSSLSQQDISLLSLTPVNLLRVVSPVHFNILLSPNALPRLPLFSLFWP